MYNIQLRKLHISDAPKIALMLNNKKIWDQLRDYIPFPYTEKDGEEFIAFVHSQSSQQVFGILNKEDELCGVVGLVVQSGIYRISAEIGYWLGEDYWGQGIMSKAVELITNYGFDELKLERIYTSVFEFNKASIRILEKNGYEKEGVFKKALIKNGNIVDEHRFAKWRSL